MLTARKLPAVLQDLMSQEASTAQAQIRRTTRCTPKEARDVYEALKDGVYAVLQFPDMVALLLGDPQPGLLKRFFSQRSSLLRKLRRGARLEAMSEVMADGDINQAQARDFLAGLQAQGDNWQRLMQLYHDPSDDFFEKRPQPKQAEGVSIELVFPPEKFDPELLLEWLRKGQHRAATRWVRQLSGASRQECQEMIDRLEEMVYEGHPDPWRVASRLWPAVVAPLAGMPNPDWLESLEEKREQLTEQILNRRSSAASQLVSETVGCSAIEARRFLRLLGDCQIWEKTILTFTTGRIFTPSPPKLQLEAPRPRVKAPTPLVAATPAAPPSESQDVPAWLSAPGPVPSETVLTGPAPSSPWATEREKEKLEAETAREQERQNAEQARQKEREDSDRRRHQEMEEADRRRHQESEATESARAREMADTQKSRELEAKSTAEARKRESAANQSQVELPPAGNLTVTAGVAAATASVTAAAASGLQAPQKLDLSDTDMVLDRLTRLGEACANQNAGEALFILDEMEQAGFNRDYVAARFPALLPLLPDDPWSDQLEELGKFAPTLSKVIKGQANPAQLAQELLKAGELDQVVMALEKAWKTKNKADVENAMALLKRNPHLTEQVNQRLPWLGDLMDLDRDGKPDVMEAIDDPGAYFSDLMRTRFPDLAARLGETRIEKIKEILPELLQAMKERNMRGVMRVMSRLRLGPSDVKALLAALKHMHH
ncbi:hypothetical protein JST97_20745 [bacterium]|nr:hypothetical protein [bacterium]